MLPHEGSCELTATLTLLAPWQRRIIDFPGYCASLHSPKFNLLLPDTIVSAKGRTVTTAQGVEVPADVIVLSTGFKVTEYLHPLSVYNSEGESLVSRLKGNGVKTYLSASPPPPVPAIGNRGHVD